MNDARKAVQAHILRVLKTMEPNGTNVDRYKTRFESMSDKDFDVWMNKLKNGETSISVFAANMESNLHIRDLMDTAEKFKVPLFDNIEMWDSVGERYTTTPTKYLIINIPVRRLKQTLSEKSSVPDSDRVTSVQSGQVVGPSKGSSVSLIESQTLVAKRLNNVVDEFFNVRGGNPEAWAAFSASLEENGVGSLAEVKQLSRPRSVETAKLYLLTRMIDNTL